MKTNEQPDERAELIERLHKHWSELDPIDPIRPDLLRAAAILEADAQQSAADDKAARDWSLLEATQESLREHMALVKELREKKYDDNEGLEPFGYFRAEPFGWTDCSSKDEGAIALYDRPSIHAGYVLVPVEPTSAMLEAGGREEVSRGWGPNEEIGEWEAEKAYRAMLAAAPKVK